MQQNTLLCPQSPGSTYNLEAGLLPSLPGPGHYLIFYWARGNRKDLVAHLPETAFLSTLQLRGAEKDLIGPVTANQMTVCT